MKLLMQLALALYQTKIYYEIQRSGENQTTYKFKYSIIHFEEAISDRQQVEIQ